MDKNNKSDSLVKKALKLDPATESEAYVDFLKKAVDEDFANLKPHVLLGYYYYKNKKVEDAAEHLKDAVKIDYLIGSDVADASNVYLTLGKIYRNLGKKEDSLSYYKDFIGLFPYSSKAETLASQIYVKLKNFDDWYASYKKASDLYKKGDYTAAAKNFRNCQKGNQSFLWSSFFLANCLLKQGSFAEAEEIFAKIASQRSYYVYKFFHYLAKKELTSQKDAALLHEIRAEAPSFLLAVYEEALLELDEGRTEKALELCDMIIRSASVELKEKAEQLKGDIAKRASADNRKSGAKGAEKKVSVEKERDDLLNDAIKEAESITMDAYAEAKMIKAAAEKEADKIKEEARQYAKSMKVSADSGSLRDKGKGIADAATAAEKIKADAEKEAETILLKAKEAALKLETAPVKSQSHAIDKEMALKKRRELEERYDKMLQELSEERKRLRYKALDDSEELLKSTEKHRAEIIRKAQEDAESIIKTASLMAEKERQHIYDKTLKYSVASIEESRKKALSEADEILSRTKEEASNIILTTKQFANKHIESVLTLVENVKENFLKEVNTSLAALLDDLKSSSISLKEDFSLSDVNGGVPFAENAASIHGKFKDPSEISTKVADAVFAQDTSTDFPSAESIVGNIVKDSDSDSFSIDFKEEALQAESKDEFLQKFISDIDLSDEDDIFDSSELSSKQPSEPREERTHEEHKVKEEKREGAESKPALSEQTELAAQDDKPLFQNEEPLFDFPAPSAQEEFFNGAGGARKTTQIEGFFVPDSSSGDSFFGSAPTGQEEAGNVSQEEKSGDIFAIWQNEEPSPFADTSAESSNVESTSSESKEESSSDEKTFGSFLSKFMDDDDEE